jgi:LuxR family maltose regulon positive regulatory protein
MAEPATTSSSAAGVAERNLLLATKLHLPRPRDGFLPRQRLLERLAEGAARELTLVCAPAGFGKTSLLSDWARRGQRPVAWLSLDGGDNEGPRWPPCSAGSPLLPPRGRLRPPTYRPTT